jgi:hypothetical protein
VCFESIEVQTVLEEENESVKVEFPLFDPYYPLGMDDSTAKP